MYASSPIQDVRRLRKGILSTSQGSTQLLDNGNVFMGWGSEPYISEHTEDGTPNMQGQFGAQNVSMSYRAFKADWVGTPDSTPALCSAAESVPHPPLSTSLGTAPPR